MRRENPRPCFHLCNYAEDFVTNLDQFLSTDDTSKGAGTGVICAGTSTPSLDPRWKVGEVFCTGLVIVAFFDSLPGALHKLATFRHLR